ncbi:MAG TPA: histidine phosphatase family protein [Opitutaceae bacterium]|nr:histidine phosphatase family protein [Opitutaceae bacterium]
MTRFLLIRHAQKDVPSDQLPGRRDGVHLTVEGRAAAKQLAAALQPFAIQRLFTSPLLRARETAEPIAAANGLEIVPVENFNEVDLGEWTGLTFAELESFPEWKTYNSVRSLAVIPGGESMLEVQARFVSQLLRFAREFPEEVIAVVSHADPIRSALLFFLGRPLDDWPSIDIAEASVSIVDANAGEANVEDASAGEMNLGDARAGEINLGDASATRFRIVAINLTADGLTERRPALSEAARNGAPASGRLP